MNLTLKRKILDNKYSILLFLYLIAIAIFPINFIPRPTFIIGSSLVMCVLIVAAKLKWNLNLLFVVPIGIIITIEAIYAFVYKKSVGIDEIGFIVETNAAEAKGVMSVLIIPSIICGIVAFFLLLKSQKELAKLRISLLNIGLFFTTGLLFLSTIVLNRVIKNGLTDEYKVAPLITIHSTLRGYAPSLFTTGISSYLYVENKMEFLRFKDFERQTPHGILLAQDSLENKQVKKIYVVLGESARYDRMSLYGHTLKTTPFLDSLSHIDNLMTYYKGVAAAPATMIAIPAIMSSATPKDYELYFKEKTLIDLAKDADYSTIWLSTQAKSAISEVIRTSVSSIARTSDYSKFIASDDPLEDFILIDFLKEYRENYSSDKELFVFHLSGSHIPYYDKIDDVDRADITGEEEGLVYDQTIYHTDRFLRKLWNEIKDEESILIYVSDHGETIGRGHSVGSFSKEDFMIPFVVLHNSKRDSKAIVEQYYYNDLDRIANSSVYNIALELMGYQLTPEYKTNAYNSGLIVRQGDKTKTVEDLIK